MKKWFLNMLVVGVLGALAVSCSDEYDELGLDSRKAQVMFSVAMDTPSARSRATWGENQNSTSALIGDDFDNKIDLNQLTVKIDAGGKTYYVVNPIKWKVEGTKNEYKIVGIVDGIDKNTTLTNPKFTVYANMDENQKKFGATYSAETPNGVQSIPMWGVMTYDGTLNFELGKRVDIGNIYLLRAMAKVEVALTEEMNEEYDLVGATLNKYNGTGYCLPDDDASNAANTTILELEEVFNPYADSKQELSFNKVGNSYVVYLPEVANGTSESDYLNIEVELKAKGASEESEPETGNFKIMDYATNPDAPTAIDIVRNHWYKYTISGFSASEVQVNYQTVDWQPINIEVGGEGFLFLNKDVIEIYNSNIDADQLKFSSSSPIKRIELKDLYTHDREGNIEEGTTDGVSAYYISKYGQKIQLGTDPGFDISDMDAALAREAVILDNIKATAEADVLNGGITINSPFLADPTNEITELQQNSHYDTPRYLEFLVTNEQDLTATFRVIQYPPVVISNIEGYFSYRDDFTRKDGEEPAYWTNYMGNGSITTMGINLTRIFDWTDEANQTDEWFATRQSDRSYAWATEREHQDGSKEGWEEMRYALIAKYVNSNLYPKGKLYMGGYRPMDHTGTPTRMFFRERYNGLPDASNMDTQGAPLSDPYEEVVINEKGEPETRIFRKYYAWDIQTIFWSRYVKKVHLEDTEITITENKKSVKYKRLKGQASMYNIADNYTTYKDGGEIFNDADVIDGGFKFVDYGITGTYRNHRMYHIKTTTTSDKYILGFPTLLDEDGNPTTNVDRGVVDNTPSNANLVSPSLMLASQLGETNYNYIIDNCKKYGYVLPKLSDFYELAKRHCREYVESTWEDTNGNGQPDEGEPVTQYHDWRLPTKAEIEMIIDYQDKSRAMDVVLMGEHFVCVTGQPGQGDDEKYWVSSEVPTYKATAEEDIDGRGYTYTGYYIRCVRDVKSGEE